MKRNVVKFLLLVVFVCISSCEAESTCETKKQCYSDGNGGQTCVDVPVPGTCISNNNFGF